MERVAVHLVRHWTRRQESSHKVGSGCGKYLTALRVKCAPGKSSFSTTIRPATLDTVANCECAKWRGRAKWAGAWGEMGFSLRAARWQRRKEKGDRSPFKVFLQQTLCCAGQLAAGSQDALIRLKTSAERWGCWKRKDTQPTRRCLKTRSSEKEKKKKYRERKKKKNTPSTDVFLLQKLQSALCVRSALSESLIALWTSEVRKWAERWRDAEAAGADTTVFTLCSGTQLNWWTAT